ncbi:MAG: hypothetical protein JXN59_07830 [Anaerolineae bacterium]|nr:hypothetical protein [Anaerolineae bacterium]
MSDPTPSPTIRQRIRAALDRPAVQVGLALAWLGVVAYLMLSPKGEGTAVTELSVLIGDSDFTDAIGHAGLFGSLTLVIAVVLARLLPARRALWIAGAGALALGLALETAQGVVGRGNTLLDYSANVIGVAAAVAFGLWVIRRSGRSPQSGR